MNLKCLSSTLWERKPKWDKGSSFLIITLVLKLSKYVNKIRGAASCSWKVMGYQGKAREGKQNVVDKFR